MRLLEPIPGGVYVDGTVGGGGHAAALLGRTEGQARVLGIDRDAAALALARERLTDWAGRVRLAQGNYADMQEIAARVGVRAVDGVLLDIGLSSNQSEAPERGFSFAADGPLDMRMDRSSGPTAADLVNELEEAPLADLLWRYGEERRSRRIAAAIVAGRRQGRIETTGRLAALVECAAGGRRGRIHPATRTFQALRIAVNDELGSLRRGLDAGLGLLRTGGRLVVISFHSLEDRLVKQFSRAHAGRHEALPAGGSEWRGETPPVEVLTRKPVTASAAELERNPRARSAKLRAMRRIAGTDVHSKREGGK